MQFLLKVKFEKVSRRPYAEKQNEDNDVIDKSKLI